MPGVWTVCLDSSVGVTGPGFDVGAWPRGIEGVGLALESKVIRGCASAAVRLDFRLEPLVSMDPKLVPLW